MAKRTPLDRFWAKVWRNGDGCWLWTGARNGGGYGTISVESKEQLAHRMSFTWLVGPIPDGFQIDHLCRVRECVNPAHLEPVTPRENTLRGNAGSAINARKTRCLRGHPFDEINTYVRPTGQRMCRLCRQRRRELERLAAM